MSMLKACGSEEPLYSDSVFSAFTYIGNGSTQTINNGIDLAGKGGLVWTKNRTNAASNMLQDTVRGVNKFIFSESTSNEVSTARGTVFNSDGYSFNNSTTDFNAFGQNYASWTFRKAPKFFDIVTYTGDGTSNRKIAHNLGIAPGMIIVKPTSITGSWYVYHASLGNSTHINLNFTNAAQTGSGQWNNTSPTATNFTLGGSVWDCNANGVTYIAYLFAHDTSTDGIIQCGSFTTDGSGNATVNLGWEPQYLMAKTSSTSGNWYMVDTARSWSVGSPDKGLYANLSNAEYTNYAIYWYPTATGFTMVNGAFPAGSTVIYLAIRRPNKPPTLGTQVYNSTLLTGNGATSTSVVSSQMSNFDMIIHQIRNSSNESGITDLLRGYNSAGTNVLMTTSTGSESVVNGSYPYVKEKWNEAGLAYIRVGGSYNGNGYSNINHFFKRAPGVFDIVCYTGTGSATTVAHGLGVTPELMIVKPRSTTGSWVVMQSFGASTFDYEYLNATSAKSNLAYGNVINSAPTTTGIAMLNDTAVNASGTTYVAYLFATKSGISSVGSYTGNGTSQTINMGFTTGARFFMCKATSTTGDWLVADTTRGIVSGSDGRLSLNSTAAEVTTEDWVDNDNTGSGIIVNQTACNANANGVSYIYLAFA